MGAPYENGGGTVYIYSGSVLGLTLTQKIMAQDISLNLKGFGFSITRATDIDMNMYAGKCVIFVIARGSGFGGLGVSVLAFSTQVRGIKPGRSHRIFKGKKTLARLPSEGK